MEDDLALALALSQSEYECSQMKQNTSNNILSESENSSQEVMLISNNNYNSASSHFIPEKKYTQNLPEEEYEELISYESNEPFHPEEFEEDNEDEEYNFPQNIEDINFEEQEIPSNFNVDEYNNDFFLVSAAQSLQNEEQLMQTGKYSDSFSKLWNLSFGGSEDSVREHKKRLKKRIAQVGLCERKIPTDGNCQFGSIADQIFGTSRAHGMVRKMVVTQLTNNPHLYQTFVLTNYNLYCMKMAEYSVWGDNVTLQAAADTLGVRINLITSIKDTVLIQITPNTQKSSRVLWLSFISQYHYNSLYSPNNHNGETASKSQSGCSLM